MVIPSPDQLSTFSSLPVFSSHPSQSQGEKDRYLLATLKSNLTITKPTLILTDLGGQDFALVFDTPFSVSEPRNPNAVAERFKEVGLKKGVTVVIKNARRTTAGREGGQGFVVLESLGALGALGDGEAGAGGGKKGGSGKGEGKGDGEGDDGSGGYLMGVVPGSLELTKKLMEVLRQKDKRGAGGEDEEKVCDGKADDGCSTPKGKGDDGKGLKRCQGCLEVWYCSKECQTRRWTAHKDECKTSKALRKIWPRPEGLEWSFRRV
ncbi:hypothetical protein B0T20DRAFT_489252 [Sordaria brevicollis]|uniref:MYND-type domain-containing protein n=1 Tax=Sordaria brevicollis TaxID=83679 RepID=A0AAE0P341_SORBR|nr:hypothetical protein B0T20DRAFT_489252 [Sordaria brevicollis]